MHNDKSYNITYRRIAADTYLYDLFFILFSYEELKDRVSTGDGQYKLVYAISGEIPGPNIVVFEDRNCKLILVAIVYCLLLYPDFFCYKDFTNDVFNKTNVKSTSTLRLTSIPVKNYFC